MNTITKLIVVNLILLAISLGILYFIYTFFFENNEYIKNHSYIGVAILLVYILLRPRARIIRSDSEDKVQIKWLTKKWDV